MSSTCRCEHDYDEHNEFGVCEHKGCECDLFVPEDYEDADTRADEAYYNHLYDDEEN